MHVTNRIIALLLLFALLIPAIALLESRGCCCFAFAAVAVASVCSWRHDGRLEEDSPQHARARDEDVAPRFARTSAPFPVRWGDVEGGGVGGDEDGIFAVYFGRHQQRHEVTQFNDILVGNGDEIIAFSTTTIKLLSWTVLFLNEIRF